MMPYWLNVGPNLEFRRCPNECGFEHRSLVRFEDDEQGLDADTDAMAAHYASCGVES